MSKRLNNITGKFKKRDLVKAGKVYNSIPKSNKIELGDYEVVSVIQILKEYKQSVDDLISIFRAESRTTIS